MFVLLSAMRKRHAERLTAAKDWVGRAGLVGQDRLAVHDDPESQDLERELQSLVSRGPRARHTLVRLADRGDWRLRVLAVSALGQIVRSDPRTASRRSLAGNLLARIPGLRRYLPTVGRHGRLVSGSLRNATVASSFIVRTAAALALGECRDPGTVPDLRALLDDPFRPVRCAAAVALAAAGHDATGVRVEPSRETTPALMAEGAPSLDWLARLARAHMAVLQEAAQVHGLPPAADDASYAAWLAGPLATSGHHGASAEVARYEYEADLEYQLAKPFGTHDRAENIRQLDAFIALVAQLDLPRGARVVDLGGGSGWVGELLARFGFHPIVVDVARPLLRFSVRRLAAHGLPGSVVAGDMTAIPLTTGSVDAMLVVDALHHVQDTQAMLREARRVLAPGGLLLIAEPGEGHSESAKSLAESREHGVRESEVYPLAIGRMATRAGFDRVDAVTRVPATGVMSVADLRRAMHTPVESWLVRDRGTVARFDTLVLRSMLARPLLVLSAGRRRPDSRSPGTLLAHIRPALHRHGAVVSGEVELTNTGDTEWLALTDGSAGTVRVGLQLLSSDGRMLNRELSRSPLPGAVLPAASCRVPVHATLPDAVQPFQLKVDLVSEGVCWFEDRGSRTTRVDV